MSLFPASFSSRLSFLRLSALVALAALTTAPPGARAQQPDAAASALQNPSGPIARESLQDPLSPEMRAPARSRLSLHYKVNVVGASAARPAVRNSVTPTCNSPRLSYFGGPVISHVQTVAVFWSSDVNSQVQSNMAQFQADLANSTYMNVLSPYGTYGSGLGSTKTNQVIASGSSSVQGVVLTPSKCAAGSGSSTHLCLLMDSDIQNELQADISANKLPAPTYDSNGDAQTLYMVYFPPHVQVNDGFGDLSCVQFCAYHGTGGTIGAPLLYGVLMDEFTSACSTGCGGNASSLQNQTDTASHEFAEAITDAEVGLDTASSYAYPAAWGDNNNNCGEIGDICDSNGPGDTISVNGRSWTVQEIWSNKDSKCESTAASLSNDPFSVNTAGSATTGTPSSFTVTAQNATGGTNTGYTGTVHISSSDADSSLPSDYVFTAGDAGVHTFNATFQTAGTQSLTATDTSYPDLTGSGSVSVSAAFQPPALTLPTPSSTLTSTSATFTWNPGSATTFQFRLGTVLGSNNIYGSGQTTSTSKTVSGLPTTGKIFARLYYMQSGTWRYVDYVYYTPTALISPTPGSTLSGSTVTFTWNPGVATAFKLQLGIVAGGNGIYGSGQTTRTSVTVNNLPTNGETIHARLNYLVGSTWYYNDYIYKAQ